MDLLFNLNIRQTDGILTVGLDWVWVRDVVRETDKDTERRNELNDGNNSSRCWPHLISEVHYRSHKAGVCGMGQYCRRSHKSTTFLVPTPSLKTSTLVPDRRQPQGYRSEV